MISKKLTGMKKLTIKTDWYAKRPEGKGYKPKSRGGKKYIGHKGGLSKPPSPPVCSKNSRGGPGPQTEKNGK